MKICLVTVARWEEDYILEWVEHYKNIGIDKIFLGDNNDSIYTPKLTNILNNYIDTGFIEITCYHDMNRIQCLHYRNIYNMYKSEFDWFCFFDCDEYLACDNIKKMLANNKYLNYNAIWVPWVIYDNNGLLKLDKTKTLQSQLTTISKNMHTCTKCKTICRNNIINGDPSIHIMHGDNVNYCFVTGTHIVPNNYGINYKDLSNNINLNIILKNFHLKHYFLKTPDDYIKKIQRGRPCKDNGHDYYKNCDINELINTYFRYNYMDSYIYIYLKNKLKKIVNDNNQ